jgi:hypothetical protein
MQEPVPSVRAQKRQMRAQRLYNARATIFRPNVKHQIANGLHYTAMSAFAALATNVLNAWMNDRGMTNRVWSITVQPNPNQPAPRNPLRHKVS